MVYDDADPQPEAWHDYVDFVIVKNEGEEQADDSTTFRSTRGTRRIQREEKRKQQLIEQLEISMKRDAEKKRKAMEQLQNPAKKRRVSSPKRKSTPQKSKSGKNELQTEISNSMMITGRHPRPTILALPLPHSL